MTTLGTKRKAQDKFNTSSIGKENKVPDEKKDPMQQDDGLIYIKNKKKRIKVQTILKQKTLFRKLPDEMALNILSFCSTEDSKNTRVWQTKIVQRCTATTCKLNAARINNLDAMKWIYNYIGDTKFVMEPKKNSYDVHHNWTGT